MQYKSLMATSLLATGAVANLGPAACISDNPKGKTYVAEFDCETAKGSIYFTATESGKGVDVEVNIEAVNGYSGPFGYHIHDQPVDASGDCASTKAHLDPYQVGQTEPCDKTKPETCEVGDLAGKHGKIEAIPYIKEYVELYASTKEGIGAFLGNRSIVIHANDEKKTRIACTNIVPVEHSDYEDEKDCTTTASYPSPTPVYPAYEEPKPCYGYDCPKTTESPVTPVYPVHPEESTPCSTDSEHPTYPSETPVYPVHPEESTPCSTDSEHPTYPSETPVYPVHPEEPEHSTPCSTSTPAPVYPPASTGYPSHPPVYPQASTGYPSHPPVYSSEDSVYPSKPENPCYGTECAHTTLVPVYPTATGYPVPPNNETTSVYSQPAPSQYTGSAATFGVSSFLAAVGAIAALVVVV